MNVVVSVGLTVEKNAPAGPYLLIKGCCLLQVTWEAVHQVALGYQITSSYTYNLYTNEAFGFMKFRGIENTLYLAVRDIVPDIVQ